MDHATLKTNWFVATAMAALLPSMLAAPALADTLDRIRESGKVTLGYRTDARPFSYQDESGKPAGYSIALCEAIAESTKTDLGLSALSVEWVPVTIQDRFQAIKDSKIDLLCGAETETLGRRTQVAFSIPIFEGGIGALVRADSPPPLREVLSGKPLSGPIWRGSPARVLEKKTFSAVAGTTSEKWLNSQIDKLQLTATVVPVDSYATGIARVLDGSTDVFFGDRPILVDAIQGNSSGSDLVVLERLFTAEPIALALARNDDDFRLAVDRALSQLYGSPAFHDLYQKWFGEPDDTTLAFFRMAALSE
jgi:polar amino acid transport system substrate-binding protein